MLNVGLENVIQIIVEAARDVVVGKRIQNVVPSPTVLSTVMVAPWSSTNCLTIESPNPNPSRADFRPSMCLIEGLEKVGLSFLGYAGPLSEMDMSI